MKRIGRLLLTIIILASCSACTGCVGSGSIAPDIKHWQKFIDSYDDNGVEGDYIKLAELNLALLETGQLVDKAFSYTQAGYNGMIPQWVHNKDVGMLLSDIYFAAGHIALSQRMAFEANVLAEKDYEPRMLRRLVQTNLIYGAYPVAAKYLGLLAKDSKSKAFCKHYSLIRTDKDTASDPILGPLKKCIPKQDFLCQINTPEEDLKHIIEANPTHTKTVDFLGMIYLMDCNIDGFRTFLDEYYGTEALPKLHGAFAEAACMMSELEPGYWKTVGLSRDDYYRYRDFRARLEKHLDVEKYKNTFWYYIMRINYLQTLNSNDQN
jgi:hypothetical protein